MGMLDNKNDSKFYLDVPQNAIGAVI